MLFKVLIISTCLLYTLSAAIVCKSNGDCDTTDFCLLSECGGIGTCARRPTICPLYCLSPPLVGCDGNTYCNDCMAHSDGVSIVNSTQPILGGWKEITNTTVPDTALDATNGLVIDGDYIVTAYSQVVNGMNYKLVYLSGEIIKIHCTADPAQTCDVFAYYNPKDIVSTASPPDNSTTPSPPSGYVTISTADLPSEIFSLVSRFVSTDGEIAYAYSYNNTSAIFYELVYVDGKIAKITCPIDNVCEITAVYSPSDLSRHLHSTGGALGGWNPVNISDIPSSVLDFIDEYGGNDVVAHIDAQIVDGENLKIQFVSGATLTVYCSVDGYCEVSSFTSSTPPAVGGWQEINETDLPEEVTYVIDGYGGIAHAYSQVVAGMNYKIEFDTGATLVLFCPPGTNSTCDITYYNNGNQDGGWTNRTTSGDIDPRVYTALAEQNVSSADVAEVYSQVVAGTNYKIVTNSGATYSIFCPLSTDLPCTVTSNSGGRLLVMVGGWKSMNVTDLPSDVYNLILQYYDNDTVVSVESQLVNGLNYRIKFSSGTCLVVYCPFDAPCEVSGIMTTTMPSMPAVGGWHEINETDLPLEVGNLAVELAGNDLMLHLYSQVVGGMNYKIEFGSGAVLTVYCPVSGNKPCEVTYFSGPAGSVPGGWSNSTTANIDPRVYTALEERNLNSTYVSQVFTQVVDGTNFKIVTVEGYTYIVYCPPAADQSCSITDEIPPSSGNNGRFLVGQDSVPSAGAINSPTILTVLLLGYVALFNL